jgi:hypothetical protein
LIYEDHFTVLFQGPFQNIDLVLVTVAISVFLDKIYRIKFLSTTSLQKRRDRAVGISTGYGLDDQGVGVRVPMGAKIFLFRVVHTGSGAHPASYTMGNEISKHWGKATWA